MTNRPELNAIHLACPNDVILQGLAETRRRSGHEFRLSLAGVINGEQLVERFASTFQIPWPISGLDAVISTASDLEWHGGASDTHPIPIVDHRTDPPSV